MADHTQGTSTCAPRRSTVSQHGVSLVGIGIGVLYLVLGIVRGELGQGLIGLGIVAAYVLLLLGLRHRSETAQLLQGRPTDERQALVMMRASAFTGQVLCVVLVVAFLVSLALGSRYASVFSSLAAVGGVTFAASTAWLSRRS